MPRKQIVSTFHENKKCIFSGYFMLFLFKCLYLTVILIQTHISVHEKHNSLYEKLQLSNKLIKNKLLKICYKCSIQKTGK